MICSQKPSSVFSLLKCVNHRRKIPGKIFCATYAVETANERRALSLKICHPFIYPFEHFFSHRLIRLLEKRSWEIFNKCQAEARRCIKIRLTIYKKRAHIHTCRSVHGCAKWRTTSALTHTHTHTHTQRVRARLHVPCMAQRKVK